MNAYENEKYRITLPKRNCDNSDVCVAQIFPKRRPFFKNTSGIFCKILARTRIYDGREYKLVLEVTFYTSRNQLAEH